VTTTPKTSICVHGTSDTADTIAVIHEVVRRMLRLLGVIPPIPCTVKIRLDGTTPGHETVHINASLQHPTLQIKEMEIVGGQYLDPPMVVFALAQFQMSTPTECVRIPPTPPTPAEIAELQNIYLEGPPPVPLPPRMQPVAVAPAADPRYVPVEFLRDVDI
jgi:hypothetical protein